MKVFKSLILAILATSCVAEAGLPWTSVEDYALCEIIDQYGEVWEIVSQKLKERNISASIRTPISCKHRFYNHINCNTYTILGCKEKYLVPPGLPEDDVIEFLASTYSPIKWSEIARIINRKFGTNRSSRYCRYRFNSYLKRIYTGAFTKEEDERLRYLSKFFGKDWQLLSTYFTNRSPMSIKARYNKIIRKNEFSEDKSEKLIQHEILGIPRIDVLETLLNHH